MLIAYFSLLRLTLFFFILISHYQAYLHVPFIVLKSILFVPKEKTIALLYKSVYIYILLNIKIYKQAPRVLFI